MKMTKYLLACFALLTLGGCKKDQTPGTEDQIAVNGIVLRLGSMSQGRTRGIVAADPTTTPPGDRTGQLLTVTIGTQSADYIYDAGSEKWIPATAGAPLSFPSLDRADVGFVLSTGAADPVANQDGTQDKLLAADVLAGAIANTIPAAELSVQLKHTKTLLDIKLSGKGFDAGKVGEVTAGDIKACNIPYGAASKTNNWQVIVAPSDATARLDVVYNGLTYTCTIVPVAQATAFAPNTRYLVNLELKGGSLVCTDIWIDPWEDGSGGEGQVTP